MLCWVLFNPLLSVYAALYCVMLRDAAWFCVVLRGAAWCCVVLRDAAGRVRELYVVIA